MRVAAQHGLNTRGRRNEDHPLIDPLFFHVAFLLRDRLDRHLKAFGRDRHVDGLQRLGVGQVRSNERQPKKRQLGESVNDAQASRCPMSVFHLRFSCLASVLTLPSPAMRERG